MNSIQSNKSIKNYAQNISYRPVFRIPMIPTKLEILWLSPDGETIPVPVRIFNLFLFESNC
jgi:hypothetical protein